MTFDFSAALRIDLDATSWVEHIPGWLSAGDQLLADLLAADGWEQRSRWMVNRTVLEPRLTVEFPDIADAPVPLLRTAAAALSVHYGVPYDGLWVNRYRDHSDSTGWHGDWPTCKRELCVVPVRDWVHSVPKQKTPAGVRVSVNFSSRAQAVRS